MTPIEIMERIEAAVKTMRMMPSTEIRSRSGYWPDVVRSFWEVYGWEPARYNRMVPAANQITEMDEALKWLGWVPGETARIIWCVAEGQSWRKIAALVHRDYKTCQTRFRLGIVTISMLISHPEKIPLANSSKKWDFEGTILADTHAT